MEGRDTTEKIATEPALDDGEDCDCNGEAVSKVEIGSYKAKVEMITDPAEEILLLWAFQQPTFSKPNAFVHHSSVDLHLDACGHRLSIFQTPSSMVSCQIISRLSLVSIHIYPKQQFLCFIQNITG